MKNILILFIFLLISPHLYSQDMEHHQVNAGAGVYSTFHKQIGSVASLEYERLILNNWVGFYVQGRLCESDNFDRSGNEKYFSTNRFDSAIGYRQYFTNESSIWRPYFGLGAFISYQSFDQDLTTNSYRVSDSFGFGLEYELSNHWVADSYNWGFGYRGCYLKIEVFSDDIKKYENHFIIFCGYSF